MTRAAEGGVRAARAVVYGVLVLAWLGSGCKGCACSRVASGLFQKAPAERLLTDVEMISDGSAPRVELRVERPVGFRYRMTVETTGGLAVEGQPLLPGATVALTLDHEVTRGSAEPLLIRKDGSSTRVIEERAVLSSIVVSHAATPPQIVAAWNAMLAPLVGTSILKQVTELGAVAQMRAELVGGVEPPEEVARSMDVALDAERHFPFRLPPVPVGVGARWRFREPISISGIHGTQTVELALQALDGSTVVVAITVRQDAPRQDVPHPFEPGKTAVLEEFHGDGSGETTLDRKTAVTRASQLKGGMRLTLSGETHGQQGSLTLVGRSTVVTTGTPLDEVESLPSGSPGEALPGTTD